MDPAMDSLRAKAHPYEDLVGEYAQRPSVHLHGAEAVVKGQVPNDSGHPLASWPRRGSRVERKIDLLVVTKSIMICEQNDELVFLQASLQAALVKLGLAASKADKFIAVIGDSLPTMRFQ
jgi:hypothetical protein